MDFDFDRTRIWLNRYLIEPAMAAWALELLHVGPNVIARFVAALLVTEALR